MWGGFSSVSAHNPNRDFEVAGAPTDSISSISFSPKSNLFVASSWDKKVYLYDAAADALSCTAKGSTTHEGPALCAAWNNDGTKIYSGGTDCKARCWDLEGGDTATSIQVAQHGAGITKMSWIEEMKALLTGSWDKSLKYWDTRSPSPAITINLTERLYAMDSLFPILVAATADRSVFLYDLRHPGPFHELKRYTSPLKYQSKSVSLFPNKAGFALGSIEGRVAVHHVEDKDASANFIFKCHRVGSDIFSVNSISFHPFGTFATAGSDGTFNFWDKDAKQRLKAFPKASMPIPAATFNNDGSIFAYAVSYDWSKGSEFYNSSDSNYILLHPVNDYEIIPRGRIKKR